MLPLREEFLTLDYSTLILLTIAWSSFIGLVLIGRRLLTSKAANRQGERVSRFINKQDSTKVKKPPQTKNTPLTRDVSKYREWINKSLGSLTSEKLQVKLSSAYWALTDKEYILIRISGTALTFLAGWFIFNNVLGGIFMGVIVYLIPPILLERAISRRQKDFQNQLMDVLVLINGAVQAGYGLLQALTLAVDEVPAPASEEFGRVLHEIRLGFTLEDGLTNLSERMENDDLQIVVTAIIINSQVGGNLSTVLEAAISTIRDRMHLFSEIQALTSYSRYVGNFLTLLPFVSGLILFFINPQYFETVKTSSLTQVVFILAAISVFIGNVWLRKIMKIKV